MNPEDQPQNQPAQQPQPSQPQQNPDPLSWYQPPQPEKPGKGFKGLNKKMLIAIGLGIFAVVLVILLMVSGGDDQQATNQTQENGETPVTGVSESDLEITTVNQSGDQVNITSLLGKKSYGLCLLVMNSTEEGNDVGYSKTGPYLRGESECKVTIPVSELSVSKKWGIRAGFADIDTGKTYESSQPASLELE